MPLTEEKLKSMLWVKTHKDEWGRREVEGIFIFVMVLGLMAWAMWVGLWHFYFRP